MTESGSRLTASLLRERAPELLENWLRELSNTAIRRDELRTREELKEECATVLRLLQDVAESERDVGEAHWAKEVDQLTRARVKQGFSPQDTSTFLFALRRPMLHVLREKTDGESLTEGWAYANELLDRLHHRMMGVYLRARDDVISRQQEEMLELSTPVVKLWDGIVAMPLIGTLDSKRAQVVMETLLTRITESGARLAIIDITGVPMVDTLVAQHLIKTVTAARLMGAECILSGIRPQIAQTIVQLGVDLEEVTTKSNLADAFGIALHRAGYVVRPAEAS